MFSGEPSLTAVALPLYMFIPPRLLEKKKQINQPALARNGSGSRTLTRNVAGLKWSLHHFSTVTPPLFYTWLFVNPENLSEDHEEVVSTVYSSSVPQQSPESNDEPFTTYFDEKVPIPEDETVSVAGPWAPDLASSPW